MREHAHVGCMPQRMRGGQRPTLRRVFSPSTIAVPGIELRWAGLVAPAFAYLDANALCVFLFFFPSLFGSLFSLLLLS